MKKSRFTEEQIVLAEWGERCGVILNFIQPGNSMQNGFIEKINKTLRTKYNLEHQNNQRSDMKFLSTRGKNRSNTLTTGCTKNGIAIMFSLARPAYK